MKMISQGAEKILAGAGAVIAGLISVIYRNMASRVKNLEQKTIDEMLPALIEIKKDVKTIKRNCVMCREPVEEKNNV